MKKVFVTRPVVMRFIILLLSLIIVLPGSADPETKIDISNLKGKFENNIRKYKLKNGLRVILMKNGFSPTIAAYLKISTGSAEEPFDMAGTAHFLEHLLFKGTHELGTSNFEKESIYLDQLIVDGERLDKVERQLLNIHLSDEQKSALIKQKRTLEKRMQIWSKGASKYIISDEDSKAYSLAGQVGYNAYTTSDVTNYQIKLPKNRLELWAEMESNRFLNPVFREFYQERKVILEERRMRYDSRPPSQLYELYLKTAFGFSAYGKPVIGFASNIPRMTYSDTKAFFENYYVPSRMVIAVVGDLEFDPTIAIIRKYFERLPDKEPPVYPPIEAEEQNGHRQAELEVDHSPVLITGFKRPPVMHQSDLAFEALQLLLAEGKTSRLVKRLVIDEKMVSSVSVYPNLPGGKYETTFSIIASPFEEKYYPKVISIIDEELNKLAKEGPTQTEMDKIKNAYFVSLVTSLSANAGLADSLSYSELIFGDYREFYDSLEKMQNLTADDIKRVATEYFIQRGRTTARIKRPVK